jgi:DNA-binding transcriptional ArsR family regulator
MTNAEFLPASQFVRVSFDLAPVSNVIDWAYTLLRTEVNPGISEWASRVVAGMSQAEYERHEIVMNALSDFFYDVQTPSLGPFASFADVVDHLAATDAQALKDKIVQDFVRTQVKTKMPEPVARPTPEALMADVEVLVAWLKHVWGKDDEEMTSYRAIHTALQDASRFKHMAVSHLYKLWTEVLSPEWDRAQPDLERIVAAYREVDYGALTLIEALRLVAGREMPSWWHEKYGSVREVVFIPSPHIGPYMVALGKPPAMRVIFGARMPKNIVARPSITPPKTLGRAEILVRLQALTDETRLRILELLTQEDELCAQDIIDKLDLSQSSVSRHLGQLTAGGYLTERRRNVAKCYSLNSARIEETLGAIAAFLRKS